MSGKKFQEFRSYVGKRLNKPGGYVVSALRVFLRLGYRRWRAV